MPINIKKVACVGAGLIGQGWATLFLAKGFEVTLQDLRQDLLKSAAQRVASNLKFMKSNGLLQEGDATPPAENIHTTTDLAEAVSGVDYIQESVFDK
jgi:carnitine 3-dehydrogenase